MKKNMLVIGLGVLVIVSLGYGFQQRQVATTALERQKELETQATEERVRAAEFQKMAELAQQEAIVQRTICEEQLKNCK